MPVLEYDHTLKLVLIGDSGVGKSSILYRYTEESFNPNYISTIGLDFRIKSVVVGGQNVRLHLWDTAGHERFKAITNSYYRGAHGIFLVYDCTNRKSFEHAVNWLDDIKRNNQDKPVIALLSNKNDLVNKVIHREEAMIFASIHGMKYYEISAKSGTRVAEAILSVTREIVTNRPLDEEISFYVKTLNIDEVNFSTCCGVKYKINTPKPKQVTIIPSQDPDQGNQT